MNLLRAMGRGRIEAALAGLLAAAGFAVSIGAGGPDSVRTFVVLAGLFFSIGYALIRSTPVGKGWGGMPALAYAFPVSLVLLYAPLFVGQLTGAGIRPLQWLARPYLLAAALLLLRDGLRPRERFAAPLLPLLIAAAIVPLALHKGAPIHVNSDVPDHIAVLRETQETGQGFPRTSYYAHSTDEVLDIRKGFGFGAMAVAGNIAGVDALRLNQTLPAWTGMIFALSFSALAAASLASPAAALLSLLFLLLTLNGGILATWFGIAILPFFFATPLVWSALLLLLRSARGDGVSRTAALLHGIALMGTHVFASVSFALLGFLFVAFLPLLRTDRRQWRSTFAALVWVGVGVLPIGVWRFLTSYPPLDPVHTHVQTVVWVGRGLFFTNPNYAFGKISLFGMLGFPLSLLLLRRVRRDAGILLILCITLFPFLIILNPILVPTLSKAVGYVIARIILFGGNHMVLGFLAVTWFRSLVKRGPVSRRALSLAALLLLHFVLVFSVRTGDATDYRSKLRGRPVRPREIPGPEQWEDVIGFIRQETPAKSVIAADPVIGYLIPGCTGRKVIAIKAQHSSPGDPFAPRRLMDIVRVLSPYVSGQETAQVLHRYDADYLLVNFRFDDLVTTLYTSIDTRDYEATLRKFRSEPELYTEIYAHDRCHLFRIRKEALVGGGRRESVLSARVDSLPDDMVRLDYGTPSGIVLVGADVEPRALAPGDFLSIVCYWKRVGSLHDPLPYKLYIRLDPPWEGEGPPWYAKFSRKWRELTTGIRERSRTVRNIGGGNNPPLVWPEEELVADTIRYEVPANMAEGEYDLQVCLKQSTMLPTAHIRDYLSEKDSYSGPSVGRVTLLARGTEGTRTTPGEEERPRPAKSQASGFTEKKPHRANLRS